MVMYDNEFKKMENEFEPRKKLNHNVHTAPTKGQITKFSLCLINMEKGKPKIFYQ